jgi:hypothetical protein
MQILTIVCEKKNKPAQTKIKTLFGFGKTSKFISFLYSAYQEREREREREREERDESIYI